MTTLDTANDTSCALEGRCDDRLADDDEAADGTPKEERWSIPSKKPREVDPMVLEPPTTAKGVEMEMRGDCKTVVDWINGHAKQKTPNKTLVAAQKQMRDWWSRGADLRRRLPTGRCAFSANTTMRPTLGRERSQRLQRRMGGRLESGLARGHWTVQVLGWKLPTGVCGAGMLIKLFTHSLGWPTIHKE